MGRKITALIAAISLVALAGCDDGGSASGTTPPNPNAAADTADMCASPVTSVVWRGERSTATTVALRGTWSDVKIIPGTTKPATAYTDLGCACLRYTFWDGAKWETEVITAASTTTFTFIRLAYLSGGIPVVVWSNGGKILQIAIRDTASVTEKGTWSVANLDTAGTVVRAVEVKVNPDDQVAILYARNTAGSSHLVLCESDCHLVANYSAPSSTLGTVGTNPHSLGLGWCSTGTSYRPVIALTGAAGSSFAICRQSSLSSCLSGISGWAGGAAFALSGTGANRATVQLAMDETTVDAPVRAIAQNGSGLAIYQSSFAGGGCAAGTPAAIAASGTIAGTAAASGSAFLELQRDANGNHHLLANESTTSVRYYNTTGGAFAAWNAAGTVATATLGAAGATRGGLAIDSSLGQGYASFARTAAASPFQGNLSFAWIEDTTLASNDANAEYYEAPQTTDGQLQLTASPVPNIATAATSAGVPAAAFVDYSANSATAGVLRYGIRVGANVPWQIRTVPVVAQPQAVSLAFDRDDRPWIGFYDLQTRRFRIVTNSRADGSGTWTTSVFPLQTPVTAATAPAYHGIAIAMDESAAAVTPVVIVGVANHATIANTGVWAAKLNPATAAWSALTQIESTNQANSVSNVTADFDAEGRIAVAYYDRSAENRVEYAQSLDGGATWSVPTRVALSTGIGAGAQAKLNPATSRPAVSYYDKANNRVYLARCSTAPASCDSLANWTTSVVENLTAGVSGLAASQEGILSTSLTFTESGTATVVYSIGAGNSGSLAINDNRTGAFPPSTVLNAGANANLFANTAISALNFGQGGWNASSVRTARGSLHSLYVGPGNWLYATGCGD